MRRLLLAVPLLFAAPAHADMLDEAIAADMPSLMSLYRELHANPELSMAEVETSAKLAADSNDSTAAGTGFGPRSGTLAQPAKRAKSAVVRINDRGMASNDTSWYHAQMTLGDCVVNRNDTR